MQISPMLRRSIVVALAYGLVSTGYYYFFNEAYDLPRAAIRGVVSAIICTGLYYLFTTVLRKRFDRRGE